MLRDQVFSHLKSIKAKVSKRKKQLKELLTLLEKANATIIAKNKELAQEKG